MKKRQVSQWNRLDNAAKIFPPTTGKRDTKVFRFACQLKGPVDGEILQIALERSLEVFPMFCSVIKKGLFWYYLENSKKKPLVHQEDAPPCGPLYDRNVKTLLFDVTYYKNRINLEVYHALTDGTGALQFLKTILYYYLRIEKKEELKGADVALDYDASVTQRMDDSFSRYYDHEQKHKEVDKEMVKVKRAYELKGSKLSEYRLKVIEGVVSVKEVLVKAREYNTTLTVFLVALVMCSIAEDMRVRDKKRPVVIVIPVNLRNFFESVSARNFFGVIKVGYDFHKNSGELKDVIEHVNESFKQELTKEKLSERMHKLGALEHNIFARIVPLFVKDFFLKIGYRIDSMGVTFSVSNVGNIKMPEELKDYVEGFDVFVSTSKEQMCMCSYGDSLTISFTSVFISGEIQKRFFRKLTQMGVGVKIYTNMNEER